MLARAGMRSTDIKAGCGRCGACSSLASFERSAGAQSTVALQGLAPR